MPLPRDLVLTRTYPDLQAYAADADTLAQAGYMAHIVTQQYTANSLELVAVQYVHAGDFAKLQAESQVEAANRLISRTITLDE